MLCSVWEGNSTPTLIALVYRPPDVPITSDMQLFQYLRTYCSDFSQKVIIGDWNANLSDTKDSDATFLKDLMNELSLKLVDTGPSHHGGKVDTWIDSIFVDNCDTILGYDHNLPTYPSRHELISVTIDIFYPSPPKVTYT